MTHATLVNEILLDIAPHALAWNNATGAVKQQDRYVRYGLPGSSDILACVKGRMVGIEVKVGRDWQRHNQQQFQTALERNGGIYILARSVEDVRHRLTAEGLL